MSEVSEFLLGYAAAFEAQNVEQISALYAYPAHVVSDGGDSVRLSTIDSPEAFHAPLQRLLDMYRRVGCKRIELAELHVEVLSSMLRRATVRWQLRGLADLPLYAFTTSYVLMRHEATWRVATAVSHDELAQYRRFIGR